MAKKSKLIIDKERQTERDRLMPKYLETIERLKESEPKHRKAGQLIIADWCLEKVKYYEQEIQKLK